MSFTMIFFGVVGLLLISYGLWVKDEKQQDIVFIFGGIALLIYSIYIQNLIFILLQGIFILSAAVELIKLLRNGR